MQLNAEYIVCMLNAMRVFDGIYQINKIKQRNRGDKPLFIHIKSVPAANLLKKTEFIAIGHADITDHVTFNGHNSCFHVISDKQYAMPFFDSLKQCRSIVINLGRDRETEAEGGGIDCNHH